MNTFLFNFIKKIKKYSSKTELIALQSGTVSIDRDILRGKLVLPKKKEINYNLFTKDNIIKIANE